MASIDSLNGINKVSDNVYEVVTTVDVGANIDNLENAIFIIKMTNVFNRGKLRFRDGCNTVFTRCNFIEMDDAGSYGTDNYNGSNARFVGANCRPVFKACTFITNDGVGRSDFDTDTVSAPSFIKDEYGSPCHMVFEGGASQFNHFASPNIIIDGLIIDDVRGGADLEFRIPPQNVNNLVIIDNNAGSNSRQFVVLMNLWSDNSTYDIKKLSARNIACWQGNNTKTIRLIDPKGDISKATNATSSQAGILEIWRSYALRPFDVANNQFINGQVTVTKGTTLVDQQTTDNYKKPLFQHRQPAGSTTIQTDNNYNDIAIDASTKKITSTTTDFTATVSAITGVTNAGLAVGDEIVIGNSSIGNDGVVIKLTAVSANSLTFTDVDGTAVTESSGANINLVRRKKYYQFLEAGGLSFIDGVSMSALHSQFMDLWDGGSLDVLDPPTTSIEPRAKSMALINYWQHLNDDTLNAIRDGAMEVRNTRNSPARLVYGLLRSNNLHEPTDQFNYWPDSQAQMDAPFKPVMKGYINQLVLLVDTDNSVDNRGQFYVRCAELRKTIIMESVNMQYAEIYPVGASNAIDPKLGNASAPFVPDATISSDANYTGITWSVDSDKTVSGTIEGTAYNFTGTLDHNNKQNNLVHEKVNYLLRQPTNINSDASGPQLRGDKQWPLTVFVGEVLNVNGGFSSNYLASDQNNIRNIDKTKVERKYSTIAAFTVEFSDSRLIGKGKMTIHDRYTHGSQVAVPVVDNGGTTLEDVQITALKMSFTFGYSGYSQGGHTPNTPLPIRINYSSPGIIEAGNSDFIINSSTSQIYPITTTPDPSYVA